MHSNIVCRKLKGILAEKDITIKQLAKKIGISENGLTLKINGKRALWFPEALLIAKVLGFNAAEDVFPEITNAIFCKNKR